MWPFSKKNIISPNHPKYQQIMEGLQYSQVDITDRFWDNLRLKPDEWIVTKPLNLMVKNPESTGLPPVDSSPEKVYEAAKKLSATREQINTKLVPYDGVYCPVCHIANTQLSKLHSPCPKCGRGLLKFGWD